MLRREGELTIWIGGEQILSVGDGRADFGPIAFRLGKKGEFRFWPRTCFIEAYSFE